MSSIFEKINSGLKDAYSHAAKEWGNPLTLKGQLNILSGGAIGLTDYAYLGSKSNWNTIKYYLIPDMRRDREVMTNSATAARRIIYGRTRVGGTMIFPETSGDKDQNLNFIVVFTGCAITGYDEIWFDDQLAATVSGGVVTMVAPFAGLATIELHDGTQTTASPFMLSQTHGAWTTAHKGCGCAYATVQLVYSESVYPSGIPQIRPVIRGKAVYDPRTATTAYSDNPALCIYDYMRLSGAIGGMGCDSSEVSEAAVITAANICDQVIAAADNEKRYTLNGFISLDATPSSIVSTMLGAMAGTALYAGGTWEIFAGASTASVATLDESWLNGGISFTAGNNKNGLANTVKGTFTNPADKWADTEFPAVINTGYLAEDCEELSTSMALQFTNSPTMAQRLANITIEKSRRGLSVSYPCNMKAADLNALDTVKINNSLLGWSEKQFKIATWDFSGMGGVNLSLVEDDIGIFADPDTYGTLTPPAMTNLPSPWVVAAPTNVVVVEQRYTGAMANNTKSRGVATWDAAGAGLQYEIALDGVIIQTVNDLTYTINDLSTGSRTISVRSINSLGAVSAWVDRTIVVGLFDDPTETLKLINPDITANKLEQYFTKEISLAELTETVNHGVLPGGVEAGTIGTLPEVLYATAQQLVMLAGEIGKQTAQIELLNDRISLKLNSNGHVAGMAIGWNESGDQSETAFLTDVFKIVLANGGDPIPAFVEQMIEGVPTLSLNGNLLVQGIITAALVNASGFTAQTANIAEAAVETLKIAGNAVTVTETVEVVNSITQGFTGTTTVGTLVLDVDENMVGIPVFIDVQGEAVTYNNSNLGVRFEFTWSGMTIYSEPDFSSSWNTGPYLGIRSVYFNGYESLNGGSSIYRWADMRDATTVYFNEPGTLTLNLRFYSQYEVALNKLMFRVSTGKR